MRQRQEVNMSLFSNISLTLQHGLNHTCKAICLSAIKEGCIFPISFFGGNGNSMLPDCRLACSAAKSLYRRDTFHLSSLFGPLCTRKIYSYKQKQNQHYATLECINNHLRVGDRIQQTYSLDREHFITKKLTHRVFVNVLCIFYYTD